MLAQHRMLAWFFRGSGPVLLRNPIFFVFFRVGGPDPLPPPPFESAHSVQLEIHSPENTNKIPDVRGLTCSTFSFIFNFYCFFI